MRKPTLRQLQIFAAVAQHKNYTRAAEELFLTQSSVSSQIKELTDAIGFPLLEHISKRIYVTNVGEELVKLYHKLDVEWQEFESEIAGINNLKSGKVRVAGVYTTQYFLPRILGEFSQRYPDIDVALKITNQQMLLDRMRANLDDVYFLGRPPEDIEVKVVPFISNPLVVIAPTHHPLATETNIAPQRLGAYPFISREAGSGTRSAVESYLDSIQKVKSRLTLGSNEAIKQAVMGGLGLSILSQHAILLELHLRQLAVLDINGFPINNTWNLMYPSGKKISPAARAFIDFSKDEGRSLAEMSLSPDICPVTFSGKASGLK
ncbi:MAG: LysR family transcriptional regulator [Gammaproteobacteria bacterium]|nr:LysR family transcriptional regulator [Gammaproteobacteria bacterium]